MALLVVNNWNMVGAGYFALDGWPVYAFFVAFNLMAVTVALNVMTVKRQARLEPGRSDECRN